MIRTPADWTVYGTAVVEFSLIRTPADWTVYGTAVVEFSLIRTPADWTVYGTAVVEFSLIRTPADWTVYGTAVVEFSLIRTPADWTVYGTVLADAVDCAYTLARQEMLWRQTENGTAQVLEELKNRGYILAVVSNSDGRIESAFAHTGLTGYFDFFIDSFNVGIEKPHPGIFLLATERAIVAPEQAAYVGDLYAVDVVGARKAGLLPILYNPFDGNRDRDCLSIRSLSDLLMLAS